MEARRPRLTAALRIVAPHFVALLTVEGDRVGHDTAPILRWAVGKQWDEVRGYMLRKRWQIELLSWESMG